MYSQYTLIQDEVKILISESIFKMCHSNLMYRFYNRRLKIISHLIIINLSFQYI